MSSFVVDKEELMKAAGFIAAFVESTRFNDDTFYIWNFKHNRKFNSEDVIASFELIHKLNAESVQEQYNDSEPEIQEKAFLKEFKTVKAQTEEMLSYRYEWYTDALRHNIYSFREFSNSVMYQIENDKKHNQVKNFLNDINSRFVGVLEKLDPHQTEVFSWGTFEISDGSEEKELYINRYNSMVQ